MYCDILTAGDSALVALSWNSHWANFLKQLENEQCRTDRVRAKEADEPGWRASAKVFFNFRVGFWSFAEVLGLGVKVA